MKKVILLTILFWLSLPVLSQTSDEVSLPENQFDSEIEKQEESDEVPLLVNQRNSEIEKQEESDEEPLLVKQRNSEIEKYEQKIEELKTFSKFRNERRDLLVKIQKLKSDLAIIEENIANARNQAEKLRSQFESQKYLIDLIPKYEIQLADYKSRLKTASIEGRQDGQSQEEYRDSIERLKQEINYYKEDIATYKTMEKNQEQLMKMIKEQEMKIRNLNTDLQNKKKDYEVAQDKLDLVEDNINTLLIPTTAQNEFKRIVAMTFASLIGLVILGFFFIASKDSHVRRAVFSGQSGIQFITLFSLVIAIVLFGITDILGGKELAALLGGISGYILGRVSENDSKEKKKPESDSDE